MWYLLACIATPMATNCTAPVEMLSAEVCEFMAEQWRGNAYSANTRAVARTRCVEVKREAASDPGSGDVMPRGFELPKL